MNFNSSNDSNYPNVFKDNSKNLNANVVLPSIQQSFSEDKEEIIINATINLIISEPEKFISMPDIITNNKRCALAYVQNFKGNSLHFLNETFKNDKDIVIEAVKKNGMNLKSANDAMKRDKDVVLTALKENPQAWKFVDTTLLRDKRVFLQAIIKNEHKELLEKEIPYSPRKRKFVPYSQAGVVESNRNKNSSNKDLHKLVKNYRGLCEIVCNFVAKEDLLKTVKNSEGAEINPLPQAITSEVLGDKKIAKSHLMIKFNALRKIGALLFSIYPNNTFSFSEQRGLVEKIGLEVNKEADHFIEKHSDKINHEIYQEIKDSLKEKKPSHLVNRTVLFKGLDRIENGQVLKLLVFSKLPLQGHSLLVKKVDEDNYTFFDPNSGIEKGLSKEELALEIDSQLKLWKGTDIYFMPADVYLKQISLKI